MPESLLISDDGYLLTHADGSIITDKDGAPCCCGGEAGCCICADIAAKPGEPCFVDYAPVPPDRLCNGAAKCCCGSRVRVTIKRVGSSHQVENSNPNDTIEDTTITETFVYEYKIEKGNGDNCVGVVTPVSYDYKSHRHFIDRFGEGHDYYDEDDDPAHGLQVFVTVAQDFAAQCRPEPAHLAWHGIMLGGSGLQWHDKWKPVIYPNWGAAWLDQGCAGTKVHDGPNGEKAVDSWTSFAKCKQASLTATATYDNANQQYPYKTSATQTVTVKVETLEDDCCPKPEFTPSLGGAPGGTSPAGESSPLGDGGYSFCRCGSLVSGEFCGRCGAKCCVGCGN